MTFSSDFFLRAISLRAQRVLVFFSARSVKPRQTGSVFLLDRVLSKTTEGHVVCQSRSRIGPEQVCETERIDRPLDCVGVDRVGDDSVGVG